MEKDMKQAYRTIMDDHFPPRMEVSFVDGDKRQAVIFSENHIEAVLQFVSIVFKRGNGLCFSHRLSFGYAALESLP